MPDIDRTIVTDSQATAGRNLFADQDTTADEKAVGSPAESGSVDQALGRTPDGDTTETAAESAAIDLSRVEVTFRHASGGARLLVPSDVPVGELLPEFLELAGVNERGEEWTLASGVGGEFGVLVDLLQGPRRSVKLGLVVVHKACVGVEWQRPILAVHLQRS